MTTRPAVAEPRTAAPRMRRVRVWFGPNLIGEFAASASRAHAYADAMPYRYQGLRVTVAELDAGRKLDPLPTERLWSLTVQ